MSYSLAGQKIHVGNFLNKRDAVKAYWQAVGVRNKNMGTPVDDIDGEVWRPTIHSSIHMVSNLGRVKTLSYNRTGVESLMKLTNSNGYLRVQVKGAMSPMFVHRLVWESFHGVIPDGMQINHINLNKHDNRLVNLEVCTARHNQNHYQESAGKRRIGVWEDKERGGWLAVVEKDGDPWYLGVYDKKVSAMMAYEDFIKNK